MRAVVWFIDLLHVSMLLGCLGPAAGVALWQAGLPLAPAWIALLAAAPLAGSVAGVVLLDLSLAWRVPGLAGRGGWTLLLLAAPVVAGPALWWGAGRRWLGRGGLARAERRAVRLQPAEATVRTVIAPVADRPPARAADRTEIAPAPARADRVEIAPAPARAVERTEDVPDRSLARVEIPERSAARAEIAAGSSARAILPRASAPTVDPWAEPWIEERTEQIRPVIRPWPRPEATAPSGISRGSR